MLPQPPLILPLPSALKALTESDTEVLPWAVDSSMGYVDDVLAKRLLTESDPLGASCGCWVGRSLCPLVLDP